MISFFCRRVFFPMLSLFILKPFMYPIWYHFTHFNAFKIDRCFLLFAFSFIHGRETRKFKSFIFRLRFKLLPMDVSMCKWMAFYFTLNDASIYLINFSAIKIYVLVRLCSWQSMPIKRIGAIKLEKWFHLSSPWNRMIIFSAPLLLRNQKREKLMEQSENGN